MTQNSKLEKRGVLVRIDGTTKDEVVKLRRDATIFGREKADVLLDDAEVSATHFQIQLVDQTYMLFDMNSTNGTSVNGSRVVKTQLQEGDEIQAGQTKFRFLMKDEQKVRHIPTRLTPETKGSMFDPLVETLIQDQLKAKQQLSIVMEVEYGDKTKEVIRLNKKLVYIGRASSFGKFDADLEISRKHMMVKLNDTGEIFVEDQGSTNGTFINQKVIKGMHLVRRTDLVELGACKLKIYPG